MSGAAEGATGEAAVRQAINGLGYLCAHLEELSAVLATSTAAANALERLRAGLRGAGDISGPLNDIHDALLRAGDALGIYGHARGLRELTLAGIGDEPVEIVYRCPAARCARTVPGPGVDPPRCGLTGEALRWEQL
jgi:hypothetical protein